MWFGCCGRSSNVEPDVVAVREKLFVLGAAFALFVAGVVALYLLEGRIRRLVLAGAFAGLILLAIGRTVRLFRSGDRNKLR